MIVALGHSEDIDSADAINEVLQACTEVLGGRTPQAGLLYAGIDHDFQELLDGIIARYPDLQLIGCTTHGEFSSAGFAEDSVVLMLLHAERVRFRAGIGEGVRADPEGATRQAVAMALNGLDAPVRLCITVPEGLGVDTTAILGTLGAELGRGVPVCGGMAGDQLRMEQTYQFCNGAVYTDAVPVLLFAGPLHVATGVASGWVPMGGEHRVTDAAGPLISEIDGEPVRDLWARYFGSTELSGSPPLIAVYPEAGPGDEPIDEEVTDFYLSAPFSFDEAGCMFMQPPVPAGARVRFADATRDQILSGVGASTACARATYPGEAPEAALVFSCAGRHAMLGTRVGRELEQFKECIGPNVPTIGFYTYGEFCPLSVSPTPHAHGSTFVTVLIGESE